MDEQENLELTANMERLAVEHCQGKLPFRARIAAVVLEGLEWVFERDNSDERSDSSSDSHPFAAGLLYLANGR